MSKDKKKKRVFRSLNDMFERFANNVIENPSPKKVEVPTNGKVKPPVISRAPDMEKKEIDPLKKEQPKPKEKEPPKKESMTSVKKRVDRIVKKHFEENPPQTRMVTSKDIRKWVMEHPSINLNSPQFLAWCRNPDGVEGDSYVAHFDKLLCELGIDHICDVEVRGYVYDFYIEPMNLYVDIDPVSLETDDPNAKITITVNKSKVDVLGVWREINESRPTRCKPYRFMAIKERLYNQGVKEFIQEYLDWYYQNMINNQGA